MQTSVATFEQDRISLPASAVERASTTRDRSGFWLVAAAIVGLLLKLALAYSTFGTNDAVTFYSFARSLSDHGLEWTYHHGVVWLASASIFNHPPLTAYFLRFIYHLAHDEFFRTNGLTFPFLLRLPGIIADFVVVLVMLHMSRADAGLRRHRWAIALLALSPVSLMVSGFHGNTDPVMVLFLVLASYMCVREQPWLCGLFFALSCQIKVIPLLFFPTFFFFWAYRRSIVPFLLPFCVTCLLLWSEPLLNFPALFIKNVISYGSYWGIWGITYWLRLTGLSAFSLVWFEGFTQAQTIIVTLLKVLIVGSVLAISWRRRALNGRGLIESIAYGWVIFFVFSPGVCAQYMVWLAPFVLILSPTFYAWLTATSSLFLFFFYNVIAHGLPWYLAVSTNQLNTVWTPWTAWPWAVLILGMVFLWSNARKANPTLRLFSLTTVKAE
ncbi:MAG: hypothetical protein QOI34_151 [Verrucomicrobiota bacterium]